MIKAMTSDKNEINNILLLIKKFIKLIETKNHFYYLSPITIADKIIIYKEKYKFNNDQQINNYQM